MLKVDAKKFLSAFLSGAAFFMCSCSDGRASANAEYVFAAENLEKSFSDFAAGDFSAAAAAARKVEDDIRGIVKKYPDSDIALKIVSDPGLHLGDISYASFRKNILPRLVLAGDETFADFDVAWAVAVFAGDEAKVAFANCLGEYPQALASAKNPSAFKKIGRDSGEKIFDKILADIFPEEAANPGIGAKGGAPFYIRARAEVLNARRLFVLAQAQNPQPESSAGPAAESLEAPAAAKRTPLPPMPDSEKFLAQAQKDASMANYNLEASARLLQYSKFVSPESAEFEQFSKCLSGALENAKKISSKKLRLGAVKNIVLAMSQIGCNAEALAELASNPDCAEMRGECLGAIAESLISRGDLDNAEAVAERLEEPSARAVFFARIIRAKLAKKDFDGAYLTAQKANGAGESAVMLEHAAHLWKSDNKKALEILAGANPQGLSAESLNSFLSKAGVPPCKSPVPQIAYADRYLEISALLAPSHPGAALKWLGIGALIAQNAGGRDAEILSEKICSILIEIKSGDAVAYASKMRGRISADLLLKFAYACAGKGDKETALEFFKMASGAGAGPRDAVRLAFAMQASNFEKPEIIKLLGGHLPKFK